MNETTPSKVSALLFDKDGTLFDFVATWEAWAKRLLLGLAQGDAQKAEALGDRIGFRFASGAFVPESYAISGTPEEIADALDPLVSHLTRDKILDEINAEAARITMAEAVPLVPLLQRFSGAGLKLGVATNDAEIPAVTHLKSVGALDLFDFVAGSDSGYGGKPATGQLLAFCAQTGVLPAEAVMVGDSTHDLVAGRAAGMTTVAVLTGVAEQADLAPFADVVLPDIGHIPEWLGLD